MKDRIIRSMSIVHIFRGTLVKDTAAKATYNGNIVLKGSNNIHADVS
jgi:hypothetical protein